MGTATNIILFCNGKEASQLIEKLALSDKTNITALVLNAQKKQRASHLILETAKKNKISEIFTFDAHVGQNLAKLCKDKNVSHGVSFLFGHKIDTSTLDLFHKGILNFHPSFLPFGRGAHPAFWAIMEGTKFGVSCHEIDENLDKGQLIAQKEIPIDEIDTGGTLYTKAMDGLLNLATETIPEWLQGKLSLSQYTLDGNYHATEELQKLTSINLKQQVNVGEFLSFLKARTFSVTDGPMYWKNGKRYVVSVQVKEVEDENC